MIIKPSMRSHSAGANAVAVPWFVAVAEMQIGVLGVVVQGVVGDAATCGFEAG